MNFVVHLLVVCPKYAMRQQTCHVRRASACAQSYKVMPGVYCFNKDDCIYGLDCYNNLCACPHPCSYDNNTSACDCGQVSALEGASPAILVGIIGGLIIIVFWYWLIKKTMNKYSKQKDNGSYNAHTETQFPLTSDYSNPTPESNPATNPVPTYPLFPRLSDSASAPPAPDATQKPPAYAFNSTEPSPVPTYPVSPKLSEKTAPVGFSASAPPAADSTQKPPAYAFNSNPYSTSPTSSPCCTTTSASANAPMDTFYPLNPVPGSVPGYSSDPAPAQCPGTGPPTYPPSGPSAPLPGAFDDPPTYDNIYKQYRKFNN